MTIDEFLKIVKNIKGVTWFLQKNIGLRARLNEYPNSPFCPITLVAYVKGEEFFCNDDWKYAAKKINLPFGRAIKIVRTVDYYPNSIPSYPSLSEKTRDKFWKLVNTSTPV